MKGSPRLNPVGIVLRAREFAARSFRYLLERGHPAPFLVFPGAHAVINPAPSKPAVRKHCLAQVRREAAARGSGLHPLVIGFIFLSVFRRTSTSHSARFNTTIQRFASGMNGVAFRGVESSITRAFSFENPPRTERSVQRESLRLIRTCRVKSVVVRGRVWRCFSVAP